MSSIRNGTGVHLDSASVYRDYWRRKQLLAQALPPYTLRRWWPSEGLCDIEKVCFDRVRSARSLLDFGAGDLRNR